MVHGLSFSLACSSIPDQGSNPCLLHWQVGSLPLSHQGSSLLVFFLFFFFRVFQFRNLWVPEVFQVLSAGLGGVCLGGGVPIRRGTSGQNLQEL